MPMLLKCALLVSRPRGWRAYLWMGLLGILQGKPEPQIALVGLYSLVSFLATAFAVNNYFDVGSDMLNPKKYNPFIGHCDRRALYVVLLNQAVALALVALLTPLFSFLVYLSTVVLGVAYSLPPFRLKARTGLELVSHMLYFGILLFLFGALLSHVQFSQQTVAIALVIGVYSAFLQLRNLRDDREFDGLIGDKTLFVRYPNFSALLLYSTAALSLLGSVYVLPVSLAVALPVAVIFGWKYGWERLVDSFVAVSLSLQVVARLCTCF